METPTNNTLPRFLFISFVLIRFSSAALSPLITNIVHIFSLSWNSLCVQLIYHIRRCGGSFIHVLNGADQPGVSSDLRLRYSTYKK